MKNSFLHSQKIQVLLLGFILLVSGCGYSNPYTADLPADGNGSAEASLHVIMWKNRSGELGYQAEIHKKLIYWLNKSPNWRITQDPEQADYLVSGVIKSADFPGLSYDRFENVKELRAEIRFSYEVRNGKTGETILAQDDLIKRETFSVSSSAAATEGEKRTALDQIADDIADEIYIRLFHELARRR